MKRCLAFRLCLSLAASFVGSGAATAQALDMEQARAAIAPFYQALNAGSDAMALINAAAGPGWESCGNTSRCSNAEQVGKAIAGFHQRVPDLKWEIHEILVSGDRVIVRGEGSGTPAGEFLGVPHGGRGFRVLSIDIHTVRDGRLSGRTYHVEDWMGATRQLSGR